MSKHTPGPWKADTPRFGYQNVRQDPADWDGRGYQLICTVPQSKKGTNYGEMFEANARLIAAAPELLEALKRLLATINPGNADSHSNDCRCVIHEARAVISKATECE